MRRHRRLGGAAIALALLAGACPEEPQETLCDPGSEVFCRCRGGEAGIKLCDDDGEAFGPCLVFGEEECEEQPDPVGGGGFGGLFPGTGGFGEGGSGNGPPPCAHELCSQGAPLDPACDPCVGAICNAAVDPFCCDLLDGSTGTWDDKCVSEVNSVCGVTCGGGEGGGGGGSGCLSASELAAGDLVITEIMNNPKAAADNVGEWLELFNATGTCINLQGVVLTSQNDLEHTVGASVVIQPGGYTVLGRSTNQRLNGHVPVAYGYGSAVQLANGDDTLTVSGSVPIDATGYASVSLEPDGASRSLDPSCLESSCNDDESAFCEATSLIADSTDRGTPGAANDDCP